MTKINSRFNLPDSLVNTAKEILFEQLDHASGKELALKQTETWFDHLKKNHSHNWNFIENKPTEVSSHTKSTFFGGEESSHYATKQFTIQNKRYPNHKIYVFGGSDVTINKKGTQKPISHDWTHQIDGMEFASGAESGVNSYGKGGLSNYLFDLSRKLK